MWQLARQRYAGAAVGGGRRGTELLEGWEGLLEETMWAVSKGDGG